MAIFGYRCSMLDRAKNGLLDVTTSLGVWHDADHDGNEGLLGMLFGHDGDGEDPGRIENWKMNLHQRELP